MLLFCFVKYVDLSLDLNFSVQNILSMHATYLIDDMIDWCIK